MILDIIEVTLYLTYICFASSYYNNIKYGDIKFRIELILFSTNIYITYNLLNHSVE